MTTNKGKQKMMFEHQITLDKKIDCIFDINSFLMNPLNFNMYIDLRNDIR